jgi:hypothetical protein
MSFPFSSDDSTAEKSWADPFEFVLWTIFIKKGARREKEKKKTG